MFMFISCLYIAKTCPYCTHEHVLLNDPPTNATGSEVRFKGSNEEPRMQRVFPPPKTETEPRPAPPSANS